MKNNDCSFFNSRRHIRTVAESVIFNFIQSLKAFSCNLILEGKVINHSEIIHTIYVEFSFNVKILNHLPEI